MSDEEKRAIKRFKNNANYCITSIETTKIILNLIEKQQAETERYKYLYQKALNNTITSDRENLKKDKIIDLMANKLHKLALYYDMEGTYCEIKNGICDEVDDVEDIHKHCTSCVKEYFKKKVEE